ncbi:trk system potassium uptake protein TrkH [Lachnospiraceae bacterium]|nr:trk system potassium uptake protein TrkH [Lachnospiraceae bacterium]
MFSFLRKLHISFFQIIFLGFAGVILLGALLLTLPCASADGSFTPFSEALFTATSAVCVTGLVVVDTGSTWSTLGKFLILMLIQIGGLGVVTTAVSITIFSGRRIDLMQRSVLQESMSAAQLGGVVRLTLFILKVTAAFELIGAALMFPVYSRAFGSGKGVFVSLFHSVSAFCNAGFDILGTQRDPYPSLVGYAADPVINIVIMILIITGGIGFLTWDDIHKNGLHARRYRLQTKIVLFTTAFLIFVPAILFFFTEYRDLPAGERVLASLFQSVTTRTAGFNTTDITKFSDTGKMMMVILMLIGGSSGSTAGGMKVTTFAVLLAVCVSCFRNRRFTHVFHRGIPESVIRKAAAVFLMYLSLFLLSAMIISNIEKLPILTCMFETASAIATVGLTLGITSKLGIFSQCILIFLMFFGRVGGLTVIYAAVGTRYEVVKYPSEEIAVG